jgi:hypothetical protein
VGWLPLKMRQRKHCYVDPINTAAPSHDVQLNLKHLLDLLPRDNVLSPGLSLWKRAFK